MSLVTGEQFGRYLEEARQLVDVVGQTAQARGLSMFSGALAGAALIRTINETMGGNIAWWVEFISCSDVDVFIASIRFTVDGTPNVPRGSRGST